MNGKNLKVITIVVKEDDQGDQYVNIQKAEDYKGEPIHPFEMLGILEFAKSIVTDGPQNG